MSYNILDVAKDLLSNNLEFASEEIKKQRLESCNQCPSNVLNICKGCGCIIPSKISLAKSVCPLNKWKQ